MVLLTVKLRSAILWLYIAGYQLFMSVVIYLNILGSKYLSSYNFRKNLIITFARTYNGT